MPRNNNDFMGGLFGGNPLDSFPKFRDTSQTAGEFLGSNPNRTTYGYVGKAKDLAQGLKLAGRANPMGPGTHIKVDMKDASAPKVSTKVRKKR